MSIFWSVDKIDFIKTHINDMTEEELANKFNCSKTAIHSTINRYKIKKKDPKAIYLSDVKLHKDEEFKDDLEILENTYKISNYGLIANKETERIIKPHTSGGYLRVSLTLPSGKKKFYLHVLVAMAFVPNPENKEFVNHKDLNRANPAYWNLEWVTKSENEKHKYSNQPELVEHIAEMNKLRSKSKDKTINKVKKVCERLLEGETVSSIAKELKVEQKWVTSIKNKHRWKEVSDEYFEDSEDLEFKIKMKNYEDLNNGFY